MQKIVRYRCEHCGVEYEDKERCECCEGRHVAPLEIVESKFEKSRANIKANNYPREIEVLFENGKVKTYFNSFIAEKESAENQSKEVRRAIGYAIDHGFKFTKLGE